MIRTCVMCGRTFEAKRATLCGPTCRKRSSRGMPPIEVPYRNKVVTVSERSVHNGDNSPDLGPNSLVAATRNELEAAGVADTMMGQQALRIASQMQGRETAGGMASLSKELSRVMAEAMRSAVSLAADPVDELQERRLAKMASAG